jgi:hypothetical protein
VGAVPGYAPLNPVVAARSVLLAYPYQNPTGGWRFSHAFEYGSAAEIDATADAHFVFDAEVFRAETALTRDLGGRWFAFAQAGVTRTHAGFADAFFDGFHALIGYRQAARDRRPRNEYGYRALLATGEAFDSPPSPLGLTDLRIGVGRRHGRHLQSLVTATLPTSRGANGYRRGVPAIGAIHTARAAVHPRALLEGTVGTGYTARNGPLADAQRTTFLSASSGLRLRVMRGHAVFGTLFYHSPVHRAAGLPELAGGELSTAFGVILRTAGGREWRLDLVEETRSSDAAIDLIVRIGSAR